MNRTLNHPHMARNAIIVHDLHMRRLEKGAKMQREKAPRIETFSYREPRRTDAE